MASILATKQSRNLLRVSWSSYMRMFSTESVNPSCSSGGQKGKRKKKKNLFEIAQFLPNWGIGYHMAKTHWQSVSYQITKINLYKDGKHGKAWGIAHKDGSPIVDAAKKISGVHKRCWRYLPNSKKFQESNTLKKIQESNTLKKIQESSTPQPEALAT